MHNVSFGEWLLACDPQTTRTLYAAMEATAYADDSSRNFLQLRGQGLVYPVVVMDLFEQLGIDYHCEAEVFRYSRLDSGLHLYGGFFHFVGSIVAGEDSRVRVAENAWHIGLKQVEANFAVGFTAQAQQTRRGFADRPVVQLEFEVELPWILREPEPD